MHMQEQRNDPVQGNAPAQQGEIAGIIMQGDVGGAMELLGKAYSLTGHVVEGNKIGRTIGYPTANLQPMEEGVVLPGQGVYAAMVYIDGAWFQSMVNVGIRPTLNLRQVTVEAHLFGFNRKIYGRIISIHFLSKIRNEMRFSSLSELKEQLHADKESALEAIALISNSLIFKDNELARLKSS